MAVPRLRDTHPFRSSIREGSRRAVARCGDDQGRDAPRRVVADEDLPEIDFVLCGSVAVNLSGARIGKGGRFSTSNTGC